jgi:DUF1680 family protein
MPSRRSFLQSAGFTAAAACCPPLGFALNPAQDEPATALKPFGYGDVELAPGLAQTQFEQTQSVLLGMNEDSLLKPWRLRAGLPAPGPDMGGWYDERGFAPGHAFGQWISALSRGYAVNRDPQAKAKVESILALYQPAISGRFYEKFRFPAYNYDKMVIGLIDAHQFAGQSQAFALLNQTTDAAEPHLPPTALDRDQQRRWRASVGDPTTDDYTWDESYTLPENQYLAWQRGAGERYRKMGDRFLLDQTWFDPLSENRNVMPNHHAYSYCNSLSSGMQCYLTTGSQKHLRAASNAFNMIITTQSFATGGWGPNESFVVPDTGALHASLNDTHHSFETPCGSYAHFKLTRYLLEVTGDGRYGDSMERVLYNTVLGVKRLEPDGHAFYYSDYTFAGEKVYFPDRWPCCSGSLPQVAADYHILTYFHDGAGSVYVNLYLPSTLKWTAQNGAQMALSQTGHYPIDGNVTMRLSASRPTDAAIRLRIPAWAAGGESIRVNGHPIAATKKSGFATIQRKWKDRDRIDLTLPTPMRLESIDAQHRDTVALLRGPLVLLAVTDQPPHITRQQLLAAQPAGEAWQAQTANGPLRLLPFTAITNEKYTTYLNVTG